jgi:hypothetical protein
VSADETPEGIQALFRQSRVFRGAYLTPLQQGQGSDMWVDVGFGTGPALFRVVGPTPSMLYQSLYRLVQDLIGQERQERNGERAAGVKEGSDLDDESSGISEPGLSTRPA